jgi:RNA polymerase sigma-70 factor (ECF subfamily)
VAHAGGCRPGSRLISFLFQSTMDTSFLEHRSLLFGIAYRMLGSVSEAEDMVQEAYLRWQGQEEGSIDSPKAWLVTTITRLCIDQLRSARRKREEYYGVWLPEPLVESSAPTPAESADLADSLTMAFMMMLERLSPLERAALLLRDVFHYDYAEIAAIVGKSEANCRQIVSRAKSGLPGVAEVPVAPSEQARKIVRQFLRATSTGEMSDLLALLTEDATLYTDGGGKVSAAGRPIHSADHVSRLFIGVRRKSPGTVDYRLAHINGRLGALGYIDGRVDRAISFDFKGERLSAIYMVRNPEKLSHLSILSFPDDSLS